MHTSFQCMDGMIIERQDSDGHIRRKGEMTLPGNGKDALIVFSPPNYSTLKRSFWLADTTTKPIHLRFKLDVSIPPQPLNKPRTVRVSFIQQQGKL